LPPATAGRIEYVASMLHTNRGDYAPALTCAQRSADLYRNSNDERGMIRALSQVAHQYARAKRFHEAEAPALEAIRRARLLGEPRVLVAVLRRCAFSLPPERIEEARTYFSEALDAARAVHDPEEVFMVCEWWVTFETTAGNLERALDIATQGLQSGGGKRTMLQGQIAGLALALGRFDQARPHARATLEYAMEAPDPLVQALSIAYWSPFHAEHNPREAAQLFGYARAQLRELRGELDTDDKLALDNAAGAIRRRMDGNGFDALVQQGAALSEDAAFAILKSASALGGIGESAIDAGDRIGTLLI
jgi:tetratricopeptide (TPR) repeat protein